MASERILIIDDKIEITDFLTDLLEPLGYRLSVAMGGQQGLAMALEEQPDLILLDVNMPGMSGLEVLEALHRHKCQVPVILMTLFGSEEIAVRALRLGVRNYIAKPFDINELLVSIEWALAECRLRRDRERLVTELQQMYYKLTQRMRELTILRAVGRSVASLMPQEKLLRRILDAAIYLTDARMGVVFLFDEGNDRLRLEAVRHGGDYHAGLQSQLQDNHAEDALRSGQPLWVSSPTKHTGVTSFLGQEAHTMLYMPITLGEEALGVLGVARLQDERRPSREIEKRLAALADYAAIALKNAQLHEAVRETIAVQTLHETMVTLSHYVNNPLQALLGVVEVLRYDPADSAVVGRSADMIERKVKEISAAISVLQDLGSVESSVYLGSINMLDIEQELESRLAAWNGGQAWST